MSIWRKQISDKHMLDFIFVWILLLVFLVFAEVAHGQTLVQSVINDGAATNYPQTTPYGTYPGSYLVAGRFSTPNQPLMDLAAFDRQENIYCMQNNSGAFTPVYNNLNSNPNQQIIMPLPFTRPVNLGVSGSAPDTLLAGGFGGSGNQTLLLGFFNSSNCNFVAGPLTAFGAQQLNSIDGPANLLNGPTLLMADSGVGGIFTYQIPNNAAANYDTGPNFVAIGAFGGQTTFGYVQEYAPPQAATFGTGYFSGNTISTANAGSLGGVQFLGFVFTDRGVVAVSASQSGVDWIIFFDKVSTSGVSNISQFTVGRAVGWPTENFISMVSGNIMGAGGFDIAVAWADNVLLFPWAPTGPSSPFWNTGDTLHTPNSSPITSLVGGPIAAPAPEFDLVAQFADGVAIEAGVAVTQTQLASPTFNPPAGIFPSPGFTLIISADTGASIFYTTDGTPPSAGSTPYTGPIQVSTSETITAIAIETDKQNSIPSSAVYIVQFPVPTITPSGGSFSGPTTVTISDPAIAAGVNVAIYFTLDGTTPNNNSPVYSQPILVNQSETVEAILGTTNPANSQFDSGPAVAVFVLSTPPPPPNMYTLSITTTGPGTVTTVPSGTTFAIGTTVVLTATTSNSIFNGWAGACAAQGTSPTCSVLMSTNQQVGATFTVIPAPPPPPPTTPSITITPSSQTTKAGGDEVTYLITATNFSGTPTFSASAQIPKGQCVIQGIALDCTTTGPTTMSVVPSNSYRGSTIFIIIAAAFFFLPRRRRLSICLGALVLAGCGSGGASAPASPVPTTIAGTPAGTYMISVTATSGTQTAPASATLIVQ